MDETAGATYDDDYDYDEHACYCHVRPPCWHCTDCPECTEGDEGDE